MSYQYHYRGSVKDCSHQMDGEGVVFESYPLETGNRFRLHRSLNNHYIVPHDMFVGQTMSQGGLNKAGSIRPFTLSNIGQIAHVEV